jgi:3-hydroxyisobutyrate dehydrogenase
VPDIAFIGLGAMGRPMAANLASRFPVTVWNRTPAVADAHAAEHGTFAAHDLEVLSAADVVCSCLPTDAEVAEVVALLGPSLRAGTVWIDHTSGDPDGSREIAAMLATRGVGYLDAPVSGGTDGAVAGTLTVMVGGDAEHLELAAPVLDAVAGTVVHVGAVGAGMAVKAVNNALLAASLWAATEGLVALRAQGVDPSAALQVINGSSGRSFATERLLPERAVTRAFPRTFALSLLAKDVGLALDVLAGTEVEGPLLHLVGELTATAATELGPEADHVELVRVVERSAGVELG